MIDTWDQLNQLTPGRRWTEIIATLDHWQYRVDFGVVEVFVFNNAATDTWSGGVVCSNRRGDLKVLVQDRETAVESARGTLRIVSEGIRALQALDLQEE